MRTHTHKQRHTHTQAMIVKILRVLPKKMDNPCRLRAWPAQIFPDLVALLSCIQTCPLGGKNLCCCLAHALLLILS